MAARTPGEHLWSTLGRREIKELGRSLVEQRFEARGCVVTRDADARSGRLVVRRRETIIEVYVSTQRAGGYALWTKRRLQLDGDRYVALVVLADGEPPQLFAVPTLAFLDPVPPLVSRDYIGLASEPEYGIELTASALDALDRYAWDAGTVDRLCGS
jgi:hypothetical protein